MKLNLPKKRISISFQPFEYAPDDDICSFNKEIIKKNIVDINLHVFRSPNWVKKRGRPSKNALNCPNQLFSTLQDKTINEFSPHSSIKESTKNHEVILSNRIRPLITDKVINESANKVYKKRGPYKKTRRMLIGSSTIDDTIS